MRYTHRYQDGFIERKALEYWHNLITHLDDKVDEREFFDFFVREDVTRQTLKMIRKTFSDEELEDTSFRFRGKKLAIHGGVSEALYDLWNGEVALRRIDNVTPGDMAVVRQNLFYLGAGTSNAERIAALEQEVECKRNYHPRSIGFGQ